MKRKKCYLNLSTESVYKPQHKIHLLLFPTCPMCSVKTQLDSVCNPSFIALCIMDNKAICQDVTASMCQLEAVMEDMGTGQWGWILGFGWINLQWQLPAASAKTLSSTISQWRRPSRSPLIGWVDSPGWGKVPCVSISHWQELCCEDNCGFVALHIEAEVGTK